MSRQASHCSSGVSPMPSTATTTGIARVAPVGIETTASRKPGGMGSGAGSSFATRAGRFPGRAVRSLLSTPVAAPVAVGEAEPEHAEENRATEVSPHRAGKGASARASDCRLAARAGGFGEFAGVFRIAGWLVLSAGRHREAAEHERYQEARDHDALFVSRLRSVVRTGAKRPAREDEEKSATRDDEKIVLASRPSDTMPRCRKRCPSKLSSPP